MDKKKLTCPSCEQDVSVPEDGIAVCRVCYAQPSLFADHDGTWRMACRCGLSTPKNKQLKCAIYVWNFMNEAFANAALAQWREGNQGDKQGISDCLPAFVPF